MNDEVEQVMEVASPSERAAAGVDESLARWRGHSEEELKKLMFGLIEAESEDPRPGSDTLRAELRQEIATVLEQREGERASYRGPGRYRTYSGRVMEVLGTIGAPDVMKERTQVVMRDEDQADRSILMTEVMTEFDHVDGHGRRRYEYLGPLENR